MDNTHLAASVNDTIALPSAAPSTSTYDKPAYNARQVHPYDSSHTSATIDAFTGILDTGRLTEIRDRAVYDQNTLTYFPIADSNTGVLFPDAVAAKTNVESALRVRPTTFKGPKQLDVERENADAHYDRQIHPGGWNKAPPVTWSREKEDLPFVGYPNPELFLANTEIITTHNMAHLGHAKLTQAMRDATVGNFDHDTYLNTVGSLLRSDAIPDGPASANIEQVVQSDGGGVNSDPLLAERMA